MRVALRLRSRELGAAVFERDLEFLAPRSAFRRAAALAASTSARRSATSAARAASASCRSCFFVGLAASVEPDVPVPVEPCGTGGVAATGAPCTGVLFGDAAATGAAAATTGTVDEGTGVLAAGTAGRAAGTLLTWRLRERARAWWETGAARGREPAPESAMSAWAGSTAAASRGRGGEVLWRGAAAPMVEEVSAAPPTSAATAATFAAVATPAALPDNHEIGPFRQAGDEHTTERSGAGRRSGRRTRAPRPCRAACPPPRGGCRSPSCVGSLLGRAART